MAINFSPAQQKLFAILGLGIAGVALYYQIAKNRNDNSVVGQSLPSLAGSTDPSSGVSGLPAVINYNIAPGSDGAYIPPSIDLSSLPTIQGYSNQPVAGAANSPDAISRLLNALQGGNSGCCQQAPATTYIALPPPPAIISVPPAQIPVMPAPQEQSYSPAALLVQRAINTEPIVNAWNRNAGFATGALGTLSTPW